MANQNKIILVGRLTADPESRVTGADLPVTKFRLAVNRPFGTGENGVDFIDIVSWSKLAEDCAAQLKKGVLTLVEGRIQNRSFEDQTGQRRWVTEVVARVALPMDKAQAGPAKAAVEAASPADDEVVDDDDLASDLPF